MNKTVTVEQCDCEAAAAWADGTMIDVYQHEALEAAFAAHRHDATLQSQEQIKLLREFVRGLDCECDSYHGFDCGRCKTLEATNG